MSTSRSGCSGMPEPSPAAAAVAKSAAVVGLSGQGQSAAGGSVPSVGVSPGPSQQQQYRQHFRASAAQWQCQSSKDARQPHLAWRQAQRGGRPRRAAAGAAGRSRCCAHAPAQAYGAWSSGHSCARRAEYPDMCKDMQGTCAWGTIGTRSMQHPYTPLPASLHRVHVQNNCATTNRQTPPRPARCA